jgi:hypothetical protein
MDWPSRLLTDIQAHKTPVSLRIPLSLSPSLAHSLSLSVLGTRGCEACLEAVAIEERVQGLPIVEHFVAVIDVVERHRERAAHEQDLPLAVVSARVCEQEGAGDARAHTWKVVLKDGAKPGSGRSVRLGSEACVCVRFGGCVQTATHRPPTAPHSRP